MSIFFRCFLLILVLICGTISVFAQSTIFNIPSTDVLSENTFYLEGDVIVHFDKYQNGGFQTLGYRGVYGVTKKLEAGANIFYTRTGDGTPLEIQPNLKYKVYENEEHRIGVSVGTQIYVPLNKAAGNKTYGMIYANASKVIEQTNGTRITGGIYQMIGVDKNFGTKTGAIVGLEQPIKGRLTFAADWYSGKNRFGYSAAGLSYSFTKQQFLMVGYNFGNTGRGNNAFSAFYGITY